MKLYRFKIQLLGADRSPVTVIKGSREAIEQYIRLTEFPDLFGGYAVWDVPAEPTTDMPGEAIGVWGSRVIQHFRRELKNCGARFDVVDDAGPEQHISLRSVNYPRP